MNTFETEEKRYRPVIIVCFKALTLLKKCIPLNGLWLNAYCSCAENAVAVAADVNEVIRVLLLRAFAAFAVDVVAVGISGY